MLNVDFPLRQCFAAYLICIGSSPIKARRRTAVSKCVPTNQAASVTRIGGEKHGAAASARRNPVVRTVYCARKIRGTERQFLGIDNRRFLLLTGTNKPDLASGGKKPAEGIEIVLGNYLAFRARREAAVSKTCKITFGIWKLSGAGVLL
ncbi:hypothetical protein U1Q18_040005 [Sarracenia purpurea var. burkii]